MSESAAKTFIFPNRPPRVALWPVADYQINCTPGGVRQARDLNGIVTGVVRRNAADNGYEYLSGGGDLEQIWSPFDPDNPPLWVLQYYRIGPCAVGGHGHGEDGEVGNHVEYARVVNGVNIVKNGMEDVDIRFYPVHKSPWGLRWLRSEYNKIMGVTTTPTPTPTPPAIPPKPPVVPPAPVPPVPPVIPPVQPPVVEPPPQPALPLAGPPSTPPTPPTPTSPPTPTPTLSAESQATAQWLRNEVLTWHTPKGQPLFGKVQKRRVTAYLDEVEAKLS